MRHLPTQLLTWGTIAGAIASAMLLAALGSPLEAKLANLPDVGLMPLPATSSEPGRQPWPQASAATPSADGRASNRKDKPTR